MKASFIIFIFFSAIAFSKNGKDERRFFNYEEARVQLLKKGIPLHQRDTDAAKKANAIAIEIYKKFYDIFGSNLDYFPPIPHIFVSKNDISINQGVLGFINEDAKRNSIKKSGNIITVSQRFLDNDKELYGVIAHELSHWFLNHTRRLDPKDKVSAIFFQRDNWIDCFNIDNWLHSTPHSGGTKELIDQSFMIGTFYNNHNINIPIDFYTDGGVYSNAMKILLQMEVKFEGNKKQSCRDVYNTYLDLKNYIKEHCEKATGNCNKNTISAYKDLEKKFIKNGNKCFKHSSSDIVRILGSALNNFNLRDLKNKYDLHLKGKGIDLSPYDIKVLKTIFEEGNPFSKLLILQELAKDQLSQNSKKLNIDLNSIRFLSFEDEADLLGEVILRAMNKNSDGMEKMVFSMMNESQKKQCQKELKESKEPEFGTLSNIYHDYCWRVHKLRKFRSTIKSMKDAAKLVRPLLDLNEIKYKD